MADSKILRPVITPYQKRQLRTMVPSNWGTQFHRRENSPEKRVSKQNFRHICNLCGKFFKEGLDLLAHAELHARGSECRCMICGEVCLGDNALAGHVQSTHKNLPQHSCALCGRRYKDSRALLKHSWEHSKEKAFSCTKCPKTFYNLVQIKRHMISHRDKTVACDICEEDFPDGRSLLNHRHCHSNAPGQRFPCNVCGKTFGTRSSQQIHFRIHTGERPYKCRFCWKAFADGGTLRKHERIHTGERPYACAVCPKAFNQRVVLREHIRSHHSDPDPKFLRSTTPYFCAVCSDMFTISEDLILHLIHHCDITTAMNRQPRVGPRRYKRRRMVKPFEPEKFIIINEREAMDEEEEYVIPEPEEKVAEGSSSSQSNNVNEVVEQSENENAPTNLCPKMIYTQKTRVPVETRVDVQIRDKAVVIKAQPAIIKTSTESSVSVRLDEQEQLKIIRNDTVYDEPQQSSLLYINEVIIDASSNQIIENEEVIEEPVQDEIPIKNSPKNG
ncbi:unnamed protein product [Ceutorhynchus assimilis]|uniref:C2H2-type domain-containing protein n=1 Tax=Ceutorhynchus assimilis TaxID=467358 RepID=A0A9N9N1J0_9CUCU|nr:unnamed protein product [Ceutorhynchus assimilis]